LTKKLYAKLGSSGRRTSGPATIEDEYALGRESQDEDLHADDSRLTHDSEMSRIHVPKSGKRRFTNL
jgi:hypothetical protein